MPEIFPNQRELSSYRMEQAKDRLRSSGILLEAGAYKDSIGRSYYAIFTATRALLALEGIDYSKHAGVISHFQLNYIKSGKLDKRYSKILSTAFQIRNNVDYSDFFIVSREDAEQQYNAAAEFIEAIEALINQL